MIDQPNIVTKNLMINILFYGYFDKNVIQQSEFKAFAIHLSLQSLFVHLIQPFHLFFTVC